MASWTFPLTETYHLNSTPCLPPTPTPQICSTHSLSISLDDNTVLPIIQAWNHGGPSFFVPISKPWRNSVGSTFELYPESVLFSLYSLFSLVPNAVIPHLDYCYSFLTCLFPAFPKPSGKFCLVWFLISYDCVHSTPATQVSLLIFRRMQPPRSLCFCSSFYVEHFSPNIHVADPFISIKSAKMPALLGILFTMVVTALIIPIPHFLLCVFALALTASQKTYNPFIYYCSLSASFLIACKHHKSPGSVRFH